MTIENTDILKQFLVCLIPGLPAITLHECAHGWMALKCGDPTARDQGRLSLNPFRHIDLFGTVILPGLMLLSHMPFIFGWAKPVPVDFRNLRNVRRDTIYVALAGPLANLAMLLGWLVSMWMVAIIHFGSKIPPESATGLIIQIAFAGVIINFALMILNLFPVLPLDGGRILGSLLPQTLSGYYKRMERYGVLILIILIVTGVFGMIMQPVMKAFLSFIGIPLANL